MTIRIQRRISLGSGLGINVSKSGFSVSQRTPFGSFGSTGYSIRSGIPGVFYRKYSGRGRKKGDTMTILFILMLLAGLVYVLFLVLKIIVLFLFNAIVWALKLVAQQFKNRQLKFNLSQQANDHQIDFVRLDTDQLPDAIKSKRIEMGKPYVSNGMTVSAGTPITTINAPGDFVVLYAESEGVITFYKVGGLRVKNGDYLYSISQKNK